MREKTFEKRFSDRALFWLLCAAGASAVYIYIFTKINGAAEDERVGAVWLLFCFAMTGMSYASRKAGRAGNAEYSLLRRFADITSSLWILFSLYVLVSYAVISFACRQFAPTPQKYRVASAFAAAFCATAFAVREASNITVTKLTVRTKKLPPDIESLKIAHITDLHLGPFTGEKRLAKILRLVRDETPDMLVITGDVADGRLEGRTREIEMFRRVKPKYGIYAVTGNHDYYDDIDGALRFMNEAGIRVLRDETEERGGVVVAGIDDGDCFAKDKWGLSRAQAFTVNVKSAYPDKFILLLRHRPIVEAGTEGMFDLQLSGHTHGGQLFPTPGSRLIFRRFPRGVKTLKKGSMLYTSNGAGYVGPPARLLAPPEIVSVDLVKE